MRAATNQRASLLRAALSLTSAKLCTVHMPAPSIVLLSSPCQSQIAYLDLTSRAGRDRHLDILAGARGNYSWPETESHQSCKSLGGGALDIGRRGWSRSSAVGVLCVPTLTQPRFNIQDCTYSCIPTVPQTRINGPYWVVASSSTGISGCMHRGSIYRSLEKATDSHAASSSWEL